MDSFYQIFHFWILYLDKPPQSLHALLETTPTNRLIHINIRLRIDLLSQQYNTKISFYWSLITSHIFQWVLIDLSCLHQLDLWLKLSAKQYVGEEGCFGTRGALEHGVLWGMWCFVTRGALGQQRFRMELL